MRVVNGLIGALLGSLFGAAVWTTVSYFTHLELGIVAWLVGLLAGIGYAIGSKGRGGMGVGASVAVIAVVGILTGKLLVANILVAKHMEQQIESIGEEDAVAALRDDVLDQFLREQRVMTWPRDRTPEDALDTGYIPPEVTKEAQNRWRRMSDESRAEYVSGIRIQAHNHLDGLTLVGTAVMFIRSFSLFDLLWVTVAIGTAFKIASRDQQTPAATPAAPVAAQPAVEAVSLRRPGEPTRAKPAVLAEAPAGNSFFRGPNPTEDFPDPAERFIARKPTPNSGKTEDGSDRAAA